MRYNTGIPYLLMFLLLVSIGCREGTEAINRNGSVTDLLAIEIGGMKQWVLIQGRDAHNPILLWLHGGPGSAQMPIHHAYTEELEKEFVVVHWDQRGAGKSNHSGFKEETMTLDQFISDGHELSGYLKKRFKRDQIYLLGHSWGSFLGIKLASQYPEDYAAFISISQVVHSRRADEISYNWLREQVEAGGTGADKTALKELGNPPFLEHDRYVRFAKMKDEFGGGMDAGFTRLFWEALGAREYSLPDYIRWLKGANRGSGPMWQETNNIDLFSEIDSIKVPVYFFTGVKDYNTPHILVKEYFKFLAAPEKYLVTFKSSAHTPFIAETERFNREIVRVKHQTKKKAEL